MGSYFHHYKLIMPISRIKLMSSGGKGSKIGSIGIQTHLRSYLGMGEVGGSKSLPKPCIGNLFDTILMQFVFFLLISHLFTLVLQVNIFSLR